MYSKTTIIGRLGRDPQLKTAKSGTQVCSFSVAVDTGYGNNKKTDWYSATAFGKQAETCAQYLKKGSLALFEGTVHLGSYQKDGKDVYYLDLAVNNVTFLSKAEPSQSQGNFQQQPQQQSDANPFVDLPADDEMPF